MARLVRVVVLEIHRKLIEEIEDKKYFLQMRIKK